MNKQRLLELAGVQLNEEAKSPAVIKYSDGKYIRKDGYEKTDNINVAKIFANMGAARSYITTKLPSHKDCKATEVEIIVKERT